MRLFRILGFVLLFCSVAVLAKDNKLGIREVGRVTFDTQVRVGEAVLPAGEYVVRHTMEGQEHIMVFQKVIGKQEFKAKCTLVALPRKADRDQTILETGTNQPPVLRELVFGGDTAKHVF